MTQQMARIEVILFLREVELFSFCSAEEILRISAIVSQRAEPAGRTIYRPRDPAEDIFCIVSGEVALERDGVEEGCLGPGDAFGYLEILSGRNRDIEAVTRAKTLLLAINEQDFFDLLSNNIDIVKSLFRHMADLFLDKQQKRSLTP